MPESASPGIGSLARRALVGFGRFWWDFLIGDTPELFVGVVVVLVAVGLLTTSHSRNTAAVILLPAAVIVLLAGTLRRAARR
jgi:hypothetical protein